jgi:hypothetical protein
LLTIDNILVLAILVLALILFVSEKLLVEIAADSFSPLFISTVRLFHLAQQNDLQKAEPTYDRIVNKGHGGLIDHDQPACSVFRQGKVRPRRSSANWLIRGIVNQVSYWPIASWYAR